LAAVAIAPAGSTPRQPDSLIAARVNAVNAFVPSLVSAVSVSEFASAFQCESGVNSTLDATGLAMLLDSIERAMCAAPSPGNRKTQRSARRRPTRRS